MRESKDLIGKSIISVADGRLLGTVRDVYVDQGLNWLTGIHLGSEGLLKRKALLIARESVVVFGVDAILVKNASVVTDSRTLAVADSWVRLSDLRGREVDTPGGTKVAAIGDVIVDQEANVVAVKLGRVFVEGPIAELGIVKREAILDPGSKDGVMTIDLIKAEQREGETLPPVIMPEEPVPDILLPETAVPDAAPEDSEEKALPDADALSAASATE